MDLQPVKPLRDEPSPEDLLAGSSCQCISYPHTKVTANGLPNY